MDRRSDEALLDRRAELLARGVDGPALDEATAPLRAMMQSQGLFVRRVTLEEPAPVLDRLVAAEPVHPINGPEDLADRLAADRRCYALEHPDLPGRPLNVVWCALWRGVPQDLARILDPTAPTEDPVAADAAAFYSIWNVEPGLVGLPGGRTLLLGAMRALRGELPALETFVTLSPVPGFRRWLDPSVGAGDPSLPTECARYLTTLDAAGRPIDPVARFHLRNGARLWAIAPDADDSERGRARSHGLMANYRYAPEDLEANRPSLRAGQPALGEQVRQLLADQPL